MASFYTQDPQVKHVVVILIWLNALFMPIWSASWVLPAGFKGARDARYAMWVSMLSMWGCRVVVGYVLGIMLGWGWLVSGWECLPTGLCGPCCFTGEWLLDVGCGNTLDPNRKSVKKASCVGINDKMQIISANDFKFKKQALTLWVGIANIRLVLTIPL